MWGSCYVQDNMRVRFLDWAEAVAAEVRQAAKHTSTGSGSSEAVCAETTIAGQSKTQAMVPNMHLDETFDVVIGTDILYEVSSTNEYDLFLTVVTTYHA